MIWPFRRRVDTTDRYARYDDLIIQALVAGAVASPSTGRRSAVVEACAGLVSRCLGMAVPSAYGDVLTAAWLGQVGRCLLLDGEAVFCIEVGPDGVVLLPVASWDVRGADPRPATWRYRIDTFAPDGGMSRTVPASEILHFRYSYDPATPWTGRSPLQRALDSGRLMTGIEEAAADESASSRGYVVPMVAEKVGEADEDGESAETAALRADLRSLRGRAAFVERALDSADSAAQDWVPRRLGHNPPAALVDLRRQAEQSIAAALGVPVPLLWGGSDSASAREAYRLFLHSTLASLGRVIEDEATMKLDREVRLDFRRLFAADVQGRARAFDSLVKGGMDVADASRLAGMTE